MYYSLTFLDWSPAPVGLRGDTVLFQSLTHSYSHNSHNQFVCQSDQTYFMSRPGIELGSCGLSDGPLFNYHHHDTWIGALPNLDSHSILTTLLLTLLYFIYKQLTVECRIWIWVVLEAVIRFVDFKTEHFTFKRYLTCSK